MQCGLGRDDYQFKGMGADIRYRPSAFGELGYTDIIVRNLHRVPAKAVLSIDRLADVITLL